MNYEKIRFISAALMLEYTNILSQVFPGVVTLQAFAKAFNELNFLYQGLNKHKLDPLSIRQRKISCSSTAMLMGLLETLQGKNPGYFVEDTRSEDGGRRISMKNKTKAHVIIRSFDDTRQTYWEMWSRDNGLPDCVVIPITDLKYLQNTVSIPGTRWFFANRVRILEVNKEAVARSEQYRSIVERYADNDATFLDYLREVYWGKRQ